MCDIFVSSGVGLGLIYLPAIVSVTYYFEKRRAFATGLAVCGSGIGTFIFAPLTKILVEEYGWKGASLIFAGVLLNCAVCGAMFRPIDISTNLDESESADEDDEHSIVLAQSAPAIDISNGGLQDKTMMPDVYVQTDNKMVIPLQTPLLREIIESDNAMPFRSLQSINRTESESPASLRRHASENMLNKVVKRNISHEEQHVRPMARKDVFYSASLHNIPLYKSNHNMYTASIMSLPREFDDSDKSCCECSPEMKDALRSMTDFSLLRDPLFLMFAISNFFTSIGFCVPYTYLPDRAILAGISENRAAFLISVIGIANTVGRVVFGWVSDRPFVNRLMLYNTALTLCGLFTALSSFCTTFELLAVYSALFGMFLGRFIHKIYQKFM